MNRSFGRRVLSWAAAAGVGCMAATALAAPAHADAYSAAYTCTLPTGSQAVTITGDLTVTPNPATVGSPVAVELQISDLGLTSPLQINSWTATSNVDVAGSETAQFQLSGSGGTVAAGAAITADLTGTWTPTAAGTAELRGGDVTINADILFLGATTITCTPDEPRPAQTVTVA